MREWTHWTERPEKLSRAPRAGGLTGAKSTVYTEAAQHTTYASANRVPLFREARPVPLDRRLRVERLATALANGTPRDELIEMIDDDVLRRTGVDIRGKSFKIGESFGALFQFRVT
jgi:hypothetical protein